MSTADEERAKPPNFAYYYPEPFWRGAEAERIKELLLFFDGVAILLPKYMYGRHRDSNPWLVDALEERGYLKILDPVEFVDEEVTKQLSNTMYNLVDQGEFRQLPQADREVMYQALSMSRMGWDADVELSEILIATLQDQKLALPTEDGVSVRLHPEVRTTFLVLLSQLAPTAGKRMGLDLDPVTWDRQRIDDLEVLLNRPCLPSSGKVVALDTESMVLDLSSRSLDEVLEFKTQHGLEYRAYLRDVRACVREASGLEPDQRSELLADRTEALKDEATRIQRAAGPRWKRWTKATVGGLGACWDTLKDPVSGVLHAVEDAVTTEPEPKPDAFSYLFQVKAELA